jgi:glycosyltransferase involved in cell wall biosynthesis
MKIWVFRNFENLPMENERLMRTAVLSDFLSSKGHDVIWFTSSFDHFKKIQRFEKDTDLNWNKVIIKIFKSIGYSKNKSVKRLIDHFLVARNVRKYLINFDQKPDIIYISFPSISLSKVAVEYALKNNIPCIVEIRDLWPKIFYKKSSNFLIARILKLTFYILERDTKFIYRNATAIFGISTEYLKYGLSYSNRLITEFDKVFPLGYNPVNISFLEEQRILSHLINLGIDFSKKIILYIGSSGAQYDWKILSRVFRRCMLDGHMEFQFVLCGNGLQLETKHSNIISLGFVGSNEIAVLCRNSHLGVLPYVIDAPQGLPNKLFEYMAYGLPILSSLGNEGKEFIDKYRIGLFYTPHSDIDFYDKLIQITENTTLHSEFKSNAHYYFQKYFISHSINTDIEYSLVHIHKKFIEQNNLNTNL